MANALRAAGNGLAEMSATRLIPRFHPRLSQFSRSIASASPASGARTSARVASHTYRSPHAGAATRAASTPSAASNSYRKPAAASTSETSSSAAADTAGSDVIEKQDFSSGLADEPLVLDEGNNGHVDWTRSFHGLSTQPFSKEAADILLAPIAADDIEVKPDGIVYLPEIKYRRILNKAFGPGGWGLAPRGETIVSPKSVTREYALLAHGRLVSIARGEQDYFSPEGIPTATEGCKSNALMRCCKDLGVASELWDPRFIRKFMKQHAKQVWAEHVVTKKKKQVWMRKDDELRYPFKESKFGA